MICSEALAHVDYEGWQVPQSALWELEKQGSWSRDLKVQESWAPGATEGQCWFNYKAERVTLPSTLLFSSSPRLMGLLDRSMHVTQPADSNLRLFWKDTHRKPRNGGQDLGLPIKLVLHTNMTVFLAVSRRKNSCWSFICAILLVQRTTSLHLFLGFRNNSF